MVSTSKIIEAARELLGVPFVHQGRTLNGIDCIGVLVYCASKIGINLVDKPTYCYPENSHQLIDELKFQLDEVPVSSKQSGDFVVIAIGGVPRHLALLTPRGMIHTNDNVGKVVEQLISEAYEKRIHSVWRLK